jgi:hypothetical protein
MITHTRELKRSGFRAQDIATEGDGTGRRRYKACSAAVIAFRPDSYRDRRDWAISADSRAARKAAPPTQRTTS